MTEPLTLTHTQSLVETHTAARRVTKWSITSFGFSHKRCRQTTVKAMDMREI
jgi:hypothetical protein